MNCTCNKGPIYCHCGIAETWSNIFDIVKGRPKLVPEEDKCKPCGDKPCNRPWCPFTKK